MMLHIGPIYNAITCVTLTKNRCQKQEEDATSVVDEEEEVEEMLGECESMDFLSLHVCIGLDWIGLDWIGLDTQVFAIMYTQKVVYHHILKASLRFSRLWFWYIAEVVYSDNIECTSELVLQSFSRQVNCTQHGAEWR